MDRKLSDEQIDRIAKNLLRDFALNDEATDEIAAAPHLWWNVRSRIEAEKTRREKYRFGWFRPQILAFGALAVLVCGAAVLFSSFAIDSNSIVVLESKVENPPPLIVQAPDNSPAVLPSPDVKSPENQLPPAPEKVSLKNNAPRNSRFVAKNRKNENSAKQPSRPSKTEISADAAIEETKTDFIALSYAANTESGQIVRVRVPSSMMVSLGVKTEVSDGAALVSAEVVIGDDGMARAIRFIR